MGPAAIRPSGPGEPAGRGQIPAPASPARASGPVQVAPRSNRLRAARVPRLPNGGPGVVHLGFESFDHIFFRQTTTFSESNSDSILERI